MLDRNLFVMCLRLPDELQLIGGLCSATLSQENCLNYKKIAADEYAAGEDPNLETLGALQETDCSSLYFIFF